MSENTDVNDDQPAGSSGGFRRSRRSMRRAERAAEREAYITGQQPLLTRRAPTLRGCFPRAATSRAATATVAVLAVPSFSREHRRGGRGARTSI